MAIETPGKKVLIITYYWPPAGGPGVQRWLKFSKYMRENGWEPVVLTTSNGWYPVIDPSLEKDVLPDMKVIRTKSFEPLRYYSGLSKSAKDATNFGMVSQTGKQGLFQKISRFIRANIFIPDARRGWNSFAVDAASRLIQQHGIDVIITTGPPHSSHLIGLKLKRKFGLPWVADFRDPWSRIYYNKFLPRLKWAASYDQRLEKAVTGAADYVVTVSNGLIRELAGAPAKTRVILNGYDDGDFSNITTGESQRFSIVHTGSLGKYQNSEGLWKALHELALEDPTFRKNLQIKLIGSTDQFLISRAAHYQLTDNLLVIQHVPHDEAIREMISASVLLFVIANTENNKMIFGGKLFEYIAARRPMLPIGPVDGEAAQLLKEYTAFRMFEYEDAAGIKSEIGRFYDSWKQKGNKGLEVSSQKTAQLSRRNLTRELCTLLDSLLPAR